MGLNRFFLFHFGETYDKLYSEKKDNPVFNAIYTGGGIL